MHLVKFEVGNPPIAMVMRCIAMCEQAGTGMRMVWEKWQKPGHPVPTYKNDRSWKAFKFFIPELDKKMNMALDIMKAMFGLTEQDQLYDEAQVTDEIRDEVIGQATRKTGRH
jgi:predicted HTH transcriptional regulator